MDNFFDLLGGVADALGAGEVVKRTLEGFVEGGERDRGEQLPAEAYVYERWLTRPRDPSVNDR